MPRPGEEREGWAGWKDQMCRAERELKTEVILRLHHWQQGHFPGGATFEATLFCVKIEVSWKELDNLLQNGSLSGFGQELEKDWGRSSWAEVSHKSLWKGRDHHIQKYFTPCPCLGPAWTQRHVMFNSCCWFLLTACPHRQRNNTAPTHAAWITTLHFNHLFMSPCLFICYDVTHLFVLPGSFMRTFSISPTLRTARLIGVVFWSRRSSRGPNDAASRSPRVKGENSENRVFWSVREDLPALFCMLDFGPGVMEGRGERTRTCKSKKSNGRRVISATEDK